MTLGWDEVRQMLGDPEGTQQDVFATEVVLGDRPATPSVAVDTTPQPAMAGLAALLVAAGLVVARRRRRSRALPTAD